MYPIGNLSSGGESTKSSLQLYLQKNMDSIQGVL